MMPSTLAMEGTQVAEMEDTQVGDTEDTQVAETVDTQVAETEDTQVAETEATQVVDMEATLAAEVMVVIRAVEAMEEGIAGMVAAVVGPMEEVAGGVALMQVRLLRQKLKPSLRAEAANDYQLISYIAISYVYYCLCSVYQYFIRSACALLCTNTSWEVVIKSWVDA